MSQPLLRAVCNRTRTLPEGWIPAHLNHPYRIMPWTDDDTDWLGPDFDEMLAEVEKEFP